MKHQAHAPQFENFGLKSRSWWLRGPLEYALLLKVTAAFGCSFSQETKSFYTASSANKAPKYPFTQRRPHLIKYAWCTPYIKNAQEQSHIYQQLRVIPGLGHSSTGRVGGICSIKASVDRQGREMAYAGGDVWPTLWTHPQQGSWEALAIK